jgi:hypothetical protein
MVPKKGAYCYKFNCLEIKSPCPRPAELTEEAPQPSKLMEAFITSLFLRGHVHQLVLHHGHVVVLVDGEIRRLRDLNAPPLVNRQPHGPLEHVDPGVAEDHCGVRLQQVNCQQEKRVSVTRIHYVQRQRNLVLVESSNRFTIF